MSSHALIRCFGMLVVLGLAGCSRADLYAWKGDPTGGASGAVGGETIYVAPNGDDANPGTLTQPLRTLARARELVRSKTHTMTGDIIVYLRGGTYPQSATLSFGTADSGNATFYVKYMAYPGERPLITGGSLIAGWTVFDATKNVYSAAVGSSGFRQLYVNGKKAVRARSPNLGANGEANFYRLSGWDKAAHNVQLATSYVSNWANFTKVELHLMTAWADNALRIASLSTSGNTAYLKFQSPEDGILFVRPNPRLDQQGWGAGRVFYFENALEFLDQSGEWYLDETTSMVYYKPRTGEDMATATVVAPILETIVSVEGASTSEQVTNLWFQGLTFAHSTYLRQSLYGYLDAQAGQYNLSADANNNQTVGRPASGVSVTNANHIHFERNVFTQLAATGLDLISGTHDDMIVGNVFTDIGGSGISIGKFTANETTEYHQPYDPTDQNEICARDTLANNYIKHVATEIQGACGIAAGYPAHIVIEHNEVEDASFTGISVGYGWTSTANAMTNNRINYNHIHHVANTLAGGAGISTMSNQGPASEIQHNYLHDISQTEWHDYAVQGLFLDEGTSGYTVAHNLMVNTPGSLISQNAGANLVTDNGVNPSGADDTSAAAGIEPLYSDIKDLAKAIPAF